MLLVLCLTLSMVPVTVQAVTARGTCGENVTWSLSDNGLLVISGTGPMAEYGSSADVPWNDYRSDIASVRIEYGVTSICYAAFYSCYYLANATIADSVITIGDGAFKFCTNLANVNIPESVTNIGADAFYGCWEFTRIVIPEGVTAIKEWTFAYCNDAEYVIIPNTVVSIGYSAFSGCKNLTSVEIPDSVTTIDDNAFSACDNLTSVTIPSSVVKIGNDAFDACKKLTRINVDADNPNYSNDDYGVLFNKGQTELIWASDAIRGDYAIPRSVNTIADYAFDYCSSLTGVTIPSRVNRIGKKAFYDCDSLTDVTIPDSVTELGEQAFSECGSLLRVETGNGLTYISDYAFYGCGSLTSVQIGNSVACIYRNAFKNCDTLTSVTIPESVIDIYQGVFDGCVSLTDIYYAGTEEQWDAIRISTYDNEPLYSATIHYNSTGPENEDSSENVGTIRYFYSWDAENQIAYFDTDPAENPFNFGSQVTAETDTAFLASVEQLVGTYVLAETRSRDDGMLLPNILISISPVQIQEGTVTAADDYNVTIDHDTYPIPDDLWPLPADVGDTVLYYAEDGKLLWIKRKEPEVPDEPDEPDEPIQNYQLVVSPAGEKHALELGQKLMLTCTLFCNEEQITDWEQPGISISHKEDTMPISYEGWDQFNWESSTHTLAIEGAAPGTAYLTISAHDPDVAVTITIEVFAPPEDEFADPTKAQWVADHLKYAKSEIYREQVMDGFSGQLNMAFHEIRDNWMIGAYNTLDQFNKILGFQFDELSETQEYELLLTQILFSYNGVTSIEEMYSLYLSETSVDIVKSLLHDESFVAGIDDKKLAELNNCINNCESVSGWATDTISLQENMTSLFGILNEIEFDFQDRFLEVLKENGISFAAGLAAEQLDAYNSSVSSCIMYLAAGEAYAKTSSAFGELLLKIRQHLDIPSDLVVLQQPLISGEDLMKMLGREVTGNYDLASNPFDIPVSITELCRAIENFYTQLEGYRTNGCEAIAQKTAERYLTASSFNIANTAADVVVSFLECVPVVKAFAVIRDLFDGTQFVIDTFTGIDDRAYHGTMVMRLYCLERIHYLTVNSLAQNTENWGRTGIGQEINRNAQYDTAMLFDESVSVYRAIRAIATEYAKKYFTPVFIADRSPYYGSFAPTTKQVIQLQMEQAQLNYEWCHITYEEFMNTNRIPLIDPDGMVIYGLKCPIDITVTDENGSTVAQWMDNTWNVKAGYEQYFYATACGEDSSSFFKVMAIPNTYTVSINGTGVGRMDAVVTDNQSEESVYFLDVPIADNTEGVFSSGGPHGLPDVLTVDHAPISGTANVHIHEYASPTFTWEDDHTCTALFSCVENDDAQTVSCVVAKETANEGSEITYRAFVKFGGNLYSICYPDTQIAFPESYSNHISEILPPIYGTRRTSFLYELSDGGYQSVIYDSGQLYLEKFDADWTPRGTMVIGLELPLWGGFYSGDRYNYVVCGRMADSEKDDGGEVYRIIKFDKEFRRLGSISFTSADTYTSTPFYCGNVSIDESNGVLTVYTSRLRPDGHQSNIALRINTENMTVSDQSGMAPSADIHVSHSFRQIVKYDGSNAVYVDLSDGFPVRSVYIQSEDFSGPAMQLPGLAGDNVTNAEVSGLEISDTHYLVVGTYLNFLEQNVFLSTVNKETRETKTRWITASSCFDPQSVYMPRITKIAENRYAVIWNCVEADGVRYVIIDETGEPVCSVKEVNGISMTDCEPIFSDGKILWLTVENGVIRTSVLSDFSEVGEFQWDVGMKEAVEPWDGTADASWYDENETEFHLSTPAQLAGLSELTAQGQTFAEKTVYLENDVFMNDSDYLHDWPAIRDWEGTFHGNGHTIYNVYQEDEGGGFFDTICEGGTVKAVTFAQGLFYQGGCVADINKGVIAFCVNRSIVFNDTFSNRLADGGICDSNYNLVYGCQNHGTVQGESIAGIVGINHESLAVVSQCANLGTVRGIHEVGGIIGYNHGWVYNCYSRGFLSDMIPSNPNTARTVAGIAAGQGNYRAGDIESCYSVNQVSADNAWWVYAIAGEGVVNGYSTPGSWQDAERITMMTTDKMHDPVFVAQLNRQTNTMLPAWVMDAEHINAGFPITVADSNQQKGIYKIQPELWIGWVDTITMHVGDTETTDYETYYNEEPISVSVEDPDIVQLSVSANKLTLTGLKEGETSLTIHFAETENVIAAEYVVTICVGPEPDPFSGQCGKNITWQYDQVSNQLTLTGWGEMYDYTSRADNQAPWSEFSGEITSVALSDGIESVGNYSFCNCTKLQKVVLPDSVTRIGVMAYSRCRSITEIVFPRNLIEIQNYAFSDSGDWLHNLFLPEHLRSIGNGAFMQCGRMNEITFPVSLETIGDDAFFNCTSIRKVTFSGSLKSIGEEAFYNCLNLSEIVFLGDAPAIADDSFYAVVADAHYPKDNGTWNDSLLQNYGGTLTWIPICTEHSYEAAVTAPTCTEQGYTTYTCKCGESYIADYVAALGHNFGEWVVITEPTTTEDGLEERSCTRCGHTEQRSIARPENPFSDVTPGSFFYDPVMWAIENGITNGTSATTFSPNDQCMRAHVVTFLWRAVGCPEPTKMDNPFVDVKPTDFYYKPVLWALENGVTSGMDATHFGPTSYCNRAQVVTFLYRTMGSPELDGMDNPFTDVQAGAFYEKPVLWAVKNGITNGLSATSFGPNSICNRAQIVTFLYRAFN